MGFSNGKVLFTTLLIIFTIFLASTKVGAARPLQGEEWVAKEGVLLESLRVSVPPSGPNPCTTVPRGAPGKCTLNGMNVAGHALPTPPAFPAAVLDMLHQSS